METTSKVWLGTTQKGVVEPASQGARPLASRVLEPNNTAKSNATSQTSAGEPAMQDYSVTGKK